MQKYFKNYAKKICDAKYFYRFFVRNLMKNELKMREKLNGKEMK